MNNLSQTPEDEPVLEAQSLNSPQPTSTQTARLEAYSDEQSDDPIPWHQRGTQSNAQAPAEAPVYAGGEGFTGPLPVTDPRADNYDPDAAAQEAANTAVEDKKLTDSESDAAKEAERLRLQTIARETNTQIANDAQGYLAQNDLLNEYTPEDIFMRNEDGTTKNDPVTGEPMVRPELTSDPVEEAARTVLDDPTKATTEEVEAAERVIIEGYEASLIPLADVGKALEKLRDTDPMQAASMSKHMNELLAGMEEGVVPLWARPAVTKVEQALAGRGISASSIGRDSLFNAIISAAMPIAQADASFEQDANKTNYQAKVQAILSDESQRFAAKQFNATSINQANQFKASMQAQADMQGAARKDNMTQFNASQANNASLSNAQQANQLAMHQGSLDAQREEFNTKNANIIAQADVAWRRSLNTAETAGINASNQANVANAFSLTNQAQQNIWQESRDAAHWAETANENMIARKHEGAMRILLASEASAAAVAQAEAGQPPSIWDQAKDKLVQQGIDSAIGWLTGGD